MSVTQDENISSSTGSDALITTTSTGKRVLSLRAQRQASGDGRVYLIIVSVTDDLGRTATSCCAVTVPKKDKPRFVAAANAQAANAVAAGIPLAVNSFGTKP